MSKSRSASIAKWTMVAAMAFSSYAAHAVTTVGGINFADNAFADVLLSSSGSYTTAGGSLSDVLTDNSASTYAFSWSPGASVTLGFTDNVLVNGVGADLAIFELGIPDTIIVGYGAASQAYLTYDTGFTAAGYALNVALVDLSDLGIADGATLTQATFDLYTQGPGTVPSLALVGAVPEPETYALMLVGAGLIGYRRLRARK